MNEVLQLAIFPLPNLVYFPGQNLPLHIFEARYRKMLEDSLQAQRRIGMVLLRPGWEKNYEGAPDTFRIGSYGNISKVDRLADGRYNLVLERSRRYEILEYVQSSPYRVAKVRPLPEGLPPPPDDQAEQIQRLVVTYMALSKQMGDDPAPRFYPDQPGDYETCVNTLSMSLGIHPLLRQELLELPSLAERGQRLELLLLRLLDRLKAQKRFNHVEFEYHSVN
ncbi:MAG: LON peptidase substrate-binding domain-containing protein [Acidobacteriota bacterium]|nr:LON peptidase substrate-binding domain-containing protein [Acidobacteriota bacterium]